MSCPHGNPIGYCDICDEIDAAFEAGKRSALAEQPAPTNCRHCGGADNVICAGQCKEQPAQQEPVAWLVESKHGNFTPYIEWSEPSYLKIQVVTPLYTTPPAPAGYAKKIESLIAERDALKARLAEQPAQQQQETVAHCEAGPEFCPVCHAETRSLALAAAIGYIQRNTPPLVSNEICNALKKSPPAQRKPWVGLTDEERRACTQSPFTADNYLAIEAKLKEKNT